MKKPLFLTITDTHLNSNNIELVTDIWKQAVDICLEKGINNILFAGDFFTARKSQEKKVLLAGKKILFDVVRNKGINIWGIPGNHDKTDLEETSSYLDIYNHLINNYKIEATVEIEGVSVSFLPYFKENGSYLERLDRLKTSDLLITHIAVNGVSNNDYYKVSNNIKVDLFGKFKKVLVGHYHNQSKIGDNIYYVGSAYQANYGEDDKKGITIIYNDLSLEFIKLNFPKYKNYSVEVSKFGEFIKSIENDGVENRKIKLKGTKEELKTIDKKEYEKLGYNIKPEIISSEVVPKELKKHTNSSIKEEFINFCNQNEFKHVEEAINYLNKIK